MHRLLLVACLLACDDGGDTTQTTDAAPADASVGDLAHATDGPAPDAALEPDAASDCHALAALDPGRVDWTWWAHEPPPSATVTIDHDPAVAPRYAARTDAPWLAVGVGSGLTLRLAPEAVTAGRRVAHVTLHDRGCEVASLEVHLEAWTAGPRRKVLVVGADGVRADALAVADTPVLDRLAAAGFRTFDASTQLTGPTVSGPGWVSILTGVEPAQHGVFGNAEWANLDRDHRTFLKVARDDLGLRTAVAAQWPPVVGNIVEPDAADWATIGDQAFVTAALSRRAPDAGQYVLDTSGSDFDTMLGVLDAGCGEVLACNDDDFGLQSRLEVALDAGQEVRIVVAGFRGRSGDYRLDISGP